MLWEFPGSSVVKTWHFHCCVLGSIPGRGTDTKLPNSLGEKPFPVSLDLAPWQVAYDVSSH